MMNVCRTCLKTPAKKHIMELENDIKDCNKNSFHIMAFCLDIEVIEDSKITMNLCNNCYRKIVSIYKFKAISLKNDAYLKSLNPVMQLGDQNLSVYVDENGIKHENLLEPDEFGPSVVECCNAAIKIENDKDGLLSNVEIEGKEEDTLQNVESDEKQLSIVQKIKYEHFEDDSKEKVPVKKKRGRPKKVKSPNRKEEWQMCEECGKTVRNLKVHSLLHEKGQRTTFQCPLCPKFFITKSGCYQHHKTAHLGIALKKKSMCDICKKEVTHLKEHQMTKHNPETLPFGCMTCERRFPNRSTFEIHISRHDGVFDLPYECDMCHKKYRFKNLVSKHIRRKHLNERNYQCKICPKTFFEKQRYIVHTESHSNERLYTCKKCGLALKTKNRFRRHNLVVHGGVKKFHCTLCSKSFKRSWSLRIHMRTHTKEKPYQCQFCHMRFARSHHLKRHEFTMHKKNQIKSE